jgi:putative nucleotidyltransferase with HDIG domain
VLVKVSVDELVCSERLSFNLYAGSGELVFEAGASLSGREMRWIQRAPVYRDTHQLPFDHEGTLLGGPQQPATSDERREFIRETASQCIYLDDGTEILSALQHFWNSLSQGTTPDLALAGVVRDQLISEVTSKVDQIMYLSQLRVRDQFTYSHTLDVAALSIALGRKMGYDEDALQELALGALLHDLGKLLIPKNIMFKSGRLTEQEFEVMKLHPALGYKIIKDELKLPDCIARPALEHQEMYGGGGYPQNLKANEIHPYSQIVKVADVYDALTSRRPYKDPIPSSKAIKIMQSEGEKSFNPELLSAFVELANYREDETTHQTKASGY